MSGEKIKNLVPFLKKTYEMVEDPNTNELISWNYKNQTFIIWDHIKFSSILLPQKFQHDNFSSFVYQLNNYGFRKVNNEPCEYYNERFQPGRKDLLYNIKRRSQNPKNEKRKEKATDASSLALKKLQSMEMELANLKDGHKKLKVEINELRQEHANLEKQLANAKFEEEKEEDMVTSLMKVLSNPSFVQRITEYVTENETRESDEQVTQNPRLGAETNNLQVSVESNYPHGVGKSLEKEPNIEDSVMILPNLNSGNYFALQKMLDDDGPFTAIDSEREITQGEQKILLELKDMITNLMRCSRGKTGIEEKDGEGKKG